MEIQTNTGLPFDAAHLSPEYFELAQWAHGLLMGQAHRVSNAANLSALIFEHLPDLNWVGFYFLDDDPMGGEAPVLMVGPFQGKPACVRIEIGQGVCGHAVSTQTTQRVADVHAFPGHIACDPASRSELVVPLVSSGAVIGVLDIDSPLPERFSEADQAGIEYLAKLYLHSLG